MIGDSPNKNMRNTKKQADPIETISIRKKYRETINRYPTTDPGAFDQSSHSPGR